MYFNNESIKSMDKIQRLNIINSITGIKPANLVGTQSKKHGSNLAIISSVVHLSSNPPLIGFFMRPHKEFRRDTFNNIQENGEFTINHVSSEIVEKAHYTSAKLDENQSEFKACGLKEEYIESFSAPFVKESHIKMGLRLKEVIEIPSSGTSLVVGEIEHLTLPEHSVNEKHYVNLEASKSIGISGLNSYYELAFKESFPFVRDGEVPNFD